MRIAIIAKSGPAAGRRIVLRGGQIARVGKADWADFALPEDLELADCHFTLQCNENSAMIKSIVQDRETKINGNPVLQCEVHHGDVIGVGGTLFQVEIEGAAKPGVENSSSTPVSTPVADHNEVLEIAEYIDLSDEAIELAKNSTDPKRFGNVLVENSKLKDALRWFAHTMPKPQAVQWACSCVEEVMQANLDSVQQAAYRSALRWARDPIDENREDAKQLAEIAKHEGIGGALAAAAGWSGGSLGPSNMPEIAPDDRLTARCVCIALTIADSRGAPAGTTVRKMGYIDRLRTVNTNHPSP
jgi:Inner membrane component of T3SS, cytoplasmic domain